MRHDTSGADDTMSSDQPWSPFGDLSRIIGSVIENWPQHGRKLSRDFAAYNGDQLATLDSVANDILLSMDDGVEKAASDYRWTCSRMLEAEMRFRRDGSSANAGFKDLLEGLYGSSHDTRRYMTGLLLSQILWPQHAGPLLYYRLEYLPSIKKGSFHLEIGPGHGLWMASVLQTDSSARLAGWDISKDCLLFTESTFQRLCPGSKPDLSIRDICDDSNQNRSADIEGEYESIVASQVFEVVADPATAARKIHESLLPGGCAFVCSPINVAAPDHLRRWVKEEELLAVLQTGGLNPKRLLRFGNQPGPYQGDSGYSLVIEAGRCASGGL